MAQVLTGAGAETGTEAWSSRRSVEAGLLVLATGLLASGLSFVDGGISGSNLSPSPLAWIVTPLLYLGFWIFNALLIDAGAKMMGRSGQRVYLLQALAPCLPVLLASGVVGIMQSSLLVIGMAHDFVTFIGVLNLAVFAAFIWFLTLRTATTYDMSKSNALSLALLPLCVLSALLLAFVLIAGSFAAVTH